MEIIINGDLILSPDDFYQQLCIQIPELGEYFGRNLDALWDYVDFFDNYTIIWNKFETSKKNIGDYCYKILNIFKERNDYLANRNKNLINVILN